MDVSYVLTNETYTKKFRLHVITVPLRTDDNWKFAEQLLLKAGQEVAAPSMAETRTYLKEREGKQWLDAPSVQLHGTIQLPESGRIHLLLRIPCPTQDFSRLGQAILETFLSSFHCAPCYALSRTTQTATSDLSISNSD